jgi:Fe2+ or Zn2+ uptake regulation protein
MGEGSVNDLRERGVRVITQRTHTWRVLAESEEHLKAEKVWEWAREALLGLELSTIYRLEALRAVGLVADSRLPEGPRVFEARSALQPAPGWCARAAGRSRTPSRRSVDGCSRR